MKMEIKNKIKWGLCAVAAALAAMGLCFAWRCPLDCVYGVDSGIFLFKRQLLWNVLGVAACAAATSSAEIYIADVSDQQKVVAVIDSIRG